MDVTTERNRAKSIKSPIDDLVPPPELNFVGGPNFKGVGRQFFGYFVQFAQLKPWEHVLDVGCGIGRMAAPLTQYLTKQGRYEGFDIVPAGIQWCQEKITPKYPNFHFQLADILNDCYNPKGRWKAAEYRFPYPSRSFDFVFLTSVFTHMLPAEVENYLREIARVLKRNGRCLMTFFLLNAESREGIELKKSPLDFQHELSGCWTANPRVPEEAIAYDEPYVLEQCRQAGLPIEQPILYGSWCGRAAFTSFQDMLIATKSRWPAALQVAANWFSRRPPTVTASSRN